MHPDIKSTKIYQNSFKSDERFRMLCFDKHTLTNAKSSKLSQRTLLAPSDWPMSLKIRLLTLKLKTFSQNVFYQHDFNNWIMHIGASLFFKLIRQLNCWLSSIYIKKRLDPHATSPAYFLDVDNSIKQHKNRSSPLVGE